MLKLPHRDSSLPLYQQIKQQVQSRIRSADWKSGTRLPSENMLVEQLGVSRMTVHRALRELTQEGYLERVHGLGTFVAKPRHHASLITLRDIAEEITSAGFEHSCRVLDQVEVKADRQLAARMELPIGATLYHLRAIHSQDNLAIQLEDRLVNPGLAPDFMSQDFSKRTATDYLISLHRPDQMEHEVRAITPAEATAKLLMIEIAQPCLELVRRTWRDSQVVTSATLTYPGDRYGLFERYRTADYAV